MSHAAAYKIQPLPRKTPLVRGPRFKILSRGSGGGRLPGKANPVPFPRAVSEADWRNAVIASNKRLHNLLIEISKTPGLHPLRGAFPCASGTLAAYVEPGTPFNESRLFSSQERAIIFTEVKVDPITKRETLQRYIFPVPQEHAKKADAVLVSEHPDYSLLQDGNELWILPSVIDCVGDFPGRNGFYRADETHGIPQGGRFYSWNGGSGYLWRKEGGAVVSVVRGEHGAHYDSVNMEETLSTPFGALIEAPMEKPKPVPQAPKEPEKAAVVSGISPEGLSQLIERAQGCLGELSKEVGECALAEVQALINSLKQQG
ncbi:hypothetical protein JW721_04805 [Candidatus Micrarchaeota archaeon]|nr:hypothetical protein [Candidatus Micrarchaeota archaeon]